MAATIAAAAVGSGQLRQDAAGGRNTALVCAAVMVLLRVIDLSVLGWNPLVSDGAPVSTMLLAGTFVVIVFGLTVPGPMRQAVTRSRAIAGTGITGPPRDATAPSSPWVQDPSAPPSADPSAPASVQWSAPQPDPATPLPELMSIAASRPDLRPTIAENPSTYPDLLQWLGQLAAGRSGNRRRAPSTHEALKDHGMSASGSAQFCQQCGSPTEGTAFCTRCGSPTLVSPSPARSAVGRGRSTTGIAVGVVVLAVVLGVAAVLGVRWWISPAPSGVSSAAAEWGAGEIDSGAANATDGARGQQSGGTG